MVGDRLLTLCFMMVLVLVTAVTPKDVVLVAIAVLAIGALIYGAYNAIQCFIEDLYPDHNEQHFDNHSEKELLAEQAYYTRMLNEVDAKLLALDNEQPELGGYLCDSCGEQYQTLNAGLKGPYNCPVPECYGVLQENKEWVEHG